MDALLLLMHPQIDWLEPEEAPDRAVVSGRENALSALMMWLSTWASYENELRELTDNGENVIVYFRQRMTGAGSGMAVESDLFMVWTIRDGLAVRMEMFFDREKALSAAGVS